MKRFITIPAIDAQVTIGQYVQAIKAAKANLDREFKHGLTCWWPCTGAQIVKQYREGLHDRINQSIPYIERGI